MQTYLVGGAVRDKLLGLTPHEHDYVVVGCTPEQMIEQGFKPVGKHFPVFLHPDTQEEYALARTERKTGQGHQAFEFHTDTTVTLEEDLIRRDLTINAIAQDNDGNIIDPYHGKADLDSRILKHVSDAFAEDPLRVFRVARFKAQLSHFNFTIAPETMALMTQMSDSGELNDLSDERIWRETFKALKSANPAAYFETLMECHAVHRAFSIVDQESIALLNHATQASDNTLVRFAAMCYKKKPTLKSVPNDHQDLAALCTKVIEPMSNISSAETFVSIFNVTDALRRRERFHLCLATCEIIAAYKRIEIDKALIMKGLDALQSIDYKAIAANTAPENIKNEIMTAKTNALDNLLP